MATRDERAEQSERTRLRLLEAGLAALQEESADRLFERLEARPISSRAAVSTGAFYHHFDGQDGYIEALLEHALANRINPPFAKATEAFMEVAGAGGSFAEAFVAATDRALHYQESNLTFILQMAVWAKTHRNRQMTQRLDRMYRLVEQEMATYFAGMLTVLGREMRPPFTLADVANAFITVFEGATLRRAVSPAAVPDGRLGTLLLPIVTLMTRSADEHADASAWLSLHQPRWPDG
jgi:AcrR family transcriptional regulator